MRVLPAILLLMLVVASPVLAAGFDFAPNRRILDRHLSIDRKIHGIPVNTLDDQALAEQAGPGSDWKLLLGTLAAFDPAVFSDRVQRMAFWINVYNIAAIKTILDHWPVDGFGELRPHLGINCASTSCVDLRQTPYSGVNLDTQLRQQGERLAKQPEKGLKIDRQAGQVAISRIFDFDAGHFKQLAGGAIPFLLNYVTDPADRDYLQQGEYQLELLGYDWTLNDTRRAD